MLKGWEFGAGLHKAVLHLINTNIITHTVFIVIVLGTKFASDVMLQHLPLKTAKHSPMTL